LVISKYLPANEFQIKQSLKDKLPELLEGLRIDKITLQVPISKFAADMIVDVSVGRTKRTLVIEIKSIGEPRNAQRAIFQLHEAVTRIVNAYPVFASSYLTESTRDLCKAAGIGYIDLTGNIYLRFANVLIDKVSPTSPERERRVLKSLSSTKTSRIIRRLLRSPKRLYSVTEIARLADVSSAEAYKVATMLELKGFAERDSKRQIRILDAERLLTDWSKSTDFRKNQVISTYSLERTPEKIMKAISLVSSRSLDRRYALTMFAGASLISPYTRFYDVCAYINGDINWWIDQLDLKEVETGSNLQLVIPRDFGIFDEMQEINGFNVVSSIQLYADLVGNPARGSEQAEMILKRINLGR